MRRIIVGRLGGKRDKIKPEARLLEGLGADSHGTDELVMAVEEKFETEILDEDDKKVKSVGDVIKFIEDTQSTQS